MTKKALMLMPAVLAGCFLSCLFDGSKSEKAGEFMPLAPGNQWFYYSGVPTDDTTATEIWTVTGIKIKNNRVYFEIEKKYTGTDYTFFDYYRTEGDRLYILNAYDPKRLLADFSLREGGTFKSPGDHFTYNVLVTGYTESTRMFVYDAPQVFDEEHEITFTRHIGITRMRSLAWGVESLLIDYNLK